MEKVTHLFLSNPPLKTDSVKPPLFENLVGGSTPPPLQKGGGVHAMITPKFCDLKIEFQNSVQDWVFCAVYITHQNCGQMSAWTVKTK